MKNIIVAAITLCIVFSTVLMGYTQSNHAFIIIKGDFQADSIREFRQIYAPRIGSGKDSAFIKNGKFVLKIPFKQPVRQYFFMITTNGSITVPSKYLLDRPGIYTMSGAVTVAGGMSNCRFTGSRSATLLESFNQQSGEIRQKIRTMLDTASSRWPKDSTYNNRLLSMGDSLNKKWQSPLVKDFVKMHADNYVAAFILCEYSEDLLTEEEVESLYKGLSPGTKQTPEGKTVFQRIKTDWKTMPGMPLANFKLPDDRDAAFALSSLKGKYVIIDFWASWCRPCRESFPQMREFYQANKARGLEICSISIDKSKSAWLKALKEENNPWIQLLDTQDISTKQFAIRGVPTQILVDRKGVIVAKQVGYSKDDDQLAEKLRSLLEKEQAN